MAHERPLFFQEHMFVPHWFLDKFLHLQCTRDKLLSTQATAYGKLPTLWVNFGSNDLFCFVFQGHGRGSFSYKMLSNVLYACRLVKHAAELHLLLEVIVMVLNSYMISMTYPKLNPSLFLQSIISSTI